MFVFLAARFTKKAVDFVFAPARVINMPKSLRYFIATLIALFFLSGATFFAMLLIAMYLANPEGTTIGILVVCFCIPLIAAFVHKIAKWLE
jgi:hypothetical protein